MKRKVVWTWLLQSHSGSNSLPHARVPPSHCQITFKHCLSWQVCVVPLLTSSCHVTILDIATVHTTSACQAIKPYLICQAQHASADMGSACCNKAALQHCILHTGTVENTAVWASSYVMHLSACCNSAQLPAPAGRPVPSPSSIAVSCRSHQRPPCPSASSVCSSKAPHHLSSACHFLPNILQQAACQSAYGRTSAASPA